MHSHFFGQSWFATYALSTERNTIKVPDDAPLELLAPLGCGVMAAMRAVLNSLRPPPGSSLAVYGTGSVGLSAVMAACLAGCHPIVAVDLHQTRRELALQLGATHAVNPQTDRVTEAVRDITAGGVDVALDTTGSPSVIRSAIDALASQGTCGLIAGSPEGTRLEADMNQILFGGRHIRGIIGGDAIPDVMIPRMIQSGAPACFHSTG